MAGTHHGDGLTFLVRMPPDWMVLDLESERIPVQVDRLLTEAAERDPGVADHRGQIERQIRTTLREARARKLSFCAVLATVIEDVLPMVAILTVAMRNRPDGSDANAIITDVSRRPGAAVSEFDLKETGRAVRARYRDTVDTPDAGRVEAAVCQYFIPAPGGSKVAVITATTPTLPLEEHFATLFDEIASTFEFVV